MHKHRSWPPLRASADEYPIVENREEEGSLAYHRSWLERFHGFDSGHAERAKLVQEEATAQMLRRLGFDVELNHEAVATLPRDADAFVGGTPAQFKATTGTSARTWHTRLKSHQADLIVLDARVAVREHERAVGRLREWARSHPGKELILVLAYKTPAEAYRVSQERLHPLDP